MANDDAVLKLLASIDRRLALLTASEAQALQETLAANLLRTPARIAMFDAIDAERGSGELAAFAGVGERAAQLFVKELLDLGLVRPVPGSVGRTVIVERDEAAIIDWYLRQDASP